MCPGGGCPRRGVLGCVFQSEEEFSRQKVILCKDKNMSKSTEV